MYLGSCPGLLRIQTDPLPSVDSKRRRGGRLGLGCGAQVGPGLGGDGEEDFDDLGVELCAGATADLVSGFGEAGSFSVGPVGGHGIEGVCDGEDARAEGDLFATQAAWIAVS